MEDLLSQVLVNCQLYQGVTEKGLDELEKELNMRLPDEYIRLLRFSNGLEGVLEDNQTYVAFWNAEMVYENNQMYEVPRLMPGILVIGGIRDSEAICIDMRENSQNYGNFFMVPFDLLDWEEAEPLGSTLEEMFEKLKNPFSLPASEKE